MRAIVVLALTAGMFAGLGCKKTKSSKASEAPSGGGGNTNYDGGAGAVQNVRKAGTRTVVLNDMHQLGTFMQLQYDENNGKMPTIDAIKANLRQSQNILEQITEGSIILTGTTNHSGLWAYELNANSNARGGIVLVAGTARRATKDEVVQLLAQR